MAWAPVAQAVAVRGDKIIAVGSDADMARYTDGQTEVIDLQGKTLLPGFIDAHIHPVLGATRLGQCSMDGESLTAADIAAAVQRITLRLLDERNAQIDKARSRYQTFIVAAEEQALRALMDEQRRGLRQRQSPPECRHHPHAVFQVRCDLERIALEEHPVRPAAASHRRWRAHPVPPGTGNPRSCPGPAAASAGSPRTGWSGGFPDR